jgi:hypothetical protein
MLTAQSVSHVRKKRKVCIGADFLPATCGCADAADKLVGVWTGLGWTGLVWSGLDFLITAFAT